MSEVRVSELQNPADADVIGNAQQCDEQISEPSEDRRNDFDYDEDGPNDSESENSSYISEEINVDTLPDDAVDRMGQESHKRKNMVNYLSFSENAQPIEKEAEDEEFADEEVPASERQ